MDITLDFVLTLVTIIGLIVSVALYNERRFNRLENRLTSLETKVMPFWDLLKKNMPHLLSNIVKNPSPLSCNNPEKMSVTQLKSLKGYLENQIAKSEYKSDVILALVYINQLLDDK